VQLTDASKKKDGDDDHRDDRNGGNSGFQVTPVDAGSHF
jgi:hypothetical protein